MKNRSMPKVFPASICAAAVLAASAAPSRAQEPSTSKIFITTFIGATQAGGDLWSINSQRVGVIPLSGGGNEIAVDTFSLTRSARPGIALGINATYFSSPRLGYSFELSLFAPDLDTDCEVTFDSQPTASTNLNRGYCQDIGRRGDAMSTVNVMFGLVYRPLPGGAVRPYFRAAAGVGDMGSGSTEVTGRYSTLDRVLVADRGSGYEPTFAGGAGLTFQLSPGYAIRLEGRDQLYRVVTLAGPADALGIAPDSKKWTHNFTLLFGVDIVLEKRRGRRY
jgi:hypothetical protein